MFESSETSAQFPIVVDDLDSSCGLLFEFLRSGWCARRVRGKKMESTDHLFDEMSAAFQFPWYFGENWAAFDECINDLDWLEWGVGFAVVIADAEPVLCRSDKGQLQAFVEIMHDTVRQWADPERNQWAKPEPMNNVAPTPMTFRVVLQTSRKQYRSCRKRWEEAGAALCELDGTEWRGSVVFNPRAEI